MENNKIPIGFNEIEPPMFPCNNSHKALVDPQAGHGIPYIRLNKQTVKPSPPVELYEKTSHAYPAIQAIVKSMYKLLGDVPDFTNVDTTL